MIRFYPYRRIDSNGDLIRYGFDVDHSIRLRTKHALSVKEILDKPFKISGPNADLNLQKYTPDVLWEILNPFLFVHWKTQLMEFSS